MRPIETRTDTEFLQALRCVQYRLPQEGRLRRLGYIHALGLRYGLMGVAATYHLLEWSSRDEERWVINASRSWPRLVEGHMRNQIIRRLPFAADDSLTVTIGRIAEQPQILALPLIHRQLSLEACLNEVCELYAATNSSAICSHWPWYRRRHARQEFFHITRESLRFAIHFYQRRQYDLEELPEIALIGE